VFVGRNTRRTRTARAVVGTSDRQRNERRASDRAYALTSGAPDASIPTPRRTQVLSCARWRHPRSRWTYRNDRPAADEGPQESLRGRGISRADYAPKPALATFRTHGLRPRQRVAHAPDRRRRRPDSATAPATDRPHASVAGAFELDRISHSWRPVIRQ